MLQKYINNSIMLNILGSVIYLLFINRNKYQMTKKKDWRIRVVKNSFRVLVRVRSFRATIQAFRAIWVLENSITVPKVQGKLQVSKFRPFRAKI